MSLVVLGDGGAGASALAGAGAGAAGRQVLGVVLVVDGDGFGRERGWGADWATGAEGFVVLGRTLGGWTGGGGAALRGGAGGGASFHGHHVVRSASGCVDDLVGLPADTMTGAEVPVLDELSGRREGDVHLRVPLAELQFVVGAREVLIAGRDGDLSDGRNTSADAGLSDDRGGRRDSGHDISNTLIPPGSGDGRIAALPLLCLAVLKFDVDVLREPPQGGVFDGVLAIGELHGANGGDADVGLAPPDPAADHPDVVDIVDFSRERGFVAVVTVAVAFGVFVDVEAEVRPQGAEVAGGHGAKYTTVEHSGVCLILRTLVNCV